MTLIPNIDLFKADTTNPFELADAGSLCCGFPSPADDFLEQSLDLNKFLIKNPSSTFYGRVSGNSMHNAGIHDGDILIIDKSLHAQDGDIAVCWINGEHTVKRLKIKKDSIYLVPENADYSMTKVMPEDNFLVWGIVIHVVKSTR